MSDKINEFVKSESLKKKAPKGVDEEKYKRCKEKVKEKSPGVNEYAVRASSLSKSDKVTMDKKEFIKEHKKLINTLNSPSHKDDKEEAKEQSKELKQYTKKGDYATENVPCGDGLSGKICRRNTSKTNKSKEFAKKFKKSYDFRDHGVMIDAKDQQAAEEGTDPKVLEYLKQMHMTMQKGESNTVPLGAGVLKLTKKDEGLFNGWWEDEQGQVAEKFDDQTLAMVAKNLIVKGWIGGEVVPELVSEPSHDDAAQDREIAREEAYMAADDAVARHNEIFHRGQEPGEPIKTGKGYIRIKYGDFELELKKSLRDFAKSWNTPGKEDLKKAVSIWRKKRVRHASEKEAIKEILDNWDMFSEDFNQVLFAVQKSKED